MSTLRIFRVEQNGESARFVTDNDGDIEIRPTDNGRFTVHRRTGAVDPLTGDPYYQMIGNYAADWSIEIVEQTRFEP